PERLAGPAQPLRPAVLGELRNRECPWAANLLTCQVCFAARETADEYTRCLAPSPRLLRHAARHRAVGGPAVRRRRATPYPPVRPAHRAHPVLRRRPRRPPRPAPD